MNTPDAVRAAFPVAAREAFLNHAAVGPTSRGVIAAIQAQMRRHAEDPFGMAATNHAEADAGRALAARLVGGAPANIAYIQNTSHGLSLIANGLGLKPGDNVVLPEPEFPSNTLPWLRLAAQGVEIRRVPVPDGRVGPDTLRPAIDARTRVVTLSHVQYFNGHRVDIAAIAPVCRAAGALLVVDGTQSIGAIALDAAATGVDALVVSAHKWMLGPLGIGFMALSDAAMDRVAVTVPGWLSVREPFAFRNTLDYLPDAQRYEPGTENAGGICGLTERLREIEAFGIAAIEARILTLLDHAAARLEALGATVVHQAAPRHRSGIMVFAHKALDSAAVVAGLLERRVRVSLRHGRVRLSPHYWNSAQDIDALANGVAEMLRPRA